MRALSGTALLGKDRAHQVTWPEPTRPSPIPAPGGTEQPPTQGHCSPGSPAQESRVPGAPRAGRAGAASAGSCLLFYPGPQHSWLQAQHMGEGLT